MIISLSHPTNTIIRSLHTQTNPQIPLKSYEEIQILKEEEKSWMQTPECQKLLEEFYKLPSSHLHLSNTSNFMEYLHQRGLKGALESSNIKKDVAMRVLSMILTNPLTLSYSLRYILPSTTSPSPSTSSSSSSSMRNIRVLCLGARSESNLPLVWWRESLLSSPNILNLSIEMCGPEILHQLHGIKVVLQLPNHHTPPTPTPIPPPTPNNIDLNHQSLQILSPKSNKCHLHKHPELHNKLLLNDIFLLYNPGYGANNLMKLQWKETLKHLLLTKKIILCTAHSYGDLLRDLEYLNELSLELDEEGEELGEPIEMILHPHQNPFSSLSLTYDQNEDIDCRVVSTNNYLYAFRMK